MDKIEELGAWLLANQSKKDSPEFQDKISEYRLLRFQQKYKEASELPDSDRKAMVLDRLRTEISNAGGTPELPQGPMVTQADEGEDYVEVPVTPTAAKKPVADTTGADAASRLLMGGAGAAAGTAASTAGIASNALANRSARVAGMQEEARLAAQARAAAQSAGAAPDVVMAAPSGSMVSRPAGPPAAPSGAPGGAPALGTSRGPAMTPAGGTGVANYGQRFGLGEIERNRALDMTKQEGGVHDLTTKRREALNTLREFAPEYRELPSGLMVNTRNARERFVQTPQGALPAPAQAALPAPAMGPAPPADVVQPTMQPAAPARAYVPPKPGPLDQVADLYQRLMRTPLVETTGRVLRRVAPPVAAAGAGLDLAEIEHELRKEAAQRDYLKMAPKGAGVAGGALSLIPPPATIAIGSGLGLGAAGLEYLKDKGYFANQ
jgi:hypothetical protein